MKVYEFNTPIPKETFELSRQQLDIDTVLYFDGWLKEWYQTGSKITFRLIQGFVVQFWHEVNQRGRQDHPHFGKEWVAFSKGEIVAEKVYEQFGDEVAPEKKVKHETHDITLPFYSFWSRHRTPDS